MRYAAPASIAIHVSLVAGAYLLMQAPEPLDGAAAQPVDIEIISLEAVASIEPSEVESQSTETLVAAGAEPIERTEAEPVETETAETEANEAEPIEPVGDPVETEVAQAEASEPTEPVEAAPALQPSVEPEVAKDVSAENLTAEPVAGTLVAGIVPTDTDMAAPAFLDAVEPVAEAEPDETVVPNLAPRVAEMAEPVETALLQPSIEEELQVAPVPRPRLVRKDVEPAKEPALVEQAEPPPKKKPAAEPAPQRKRRASIPADPGTPGNSNVNADAGRQSGGKGQSQESGQAAVSRYEGQVQAKVARAMRVPRSARRGGVVRVQFVISASGKVTQVSIIGSSGDDAIDDAAIAAVKRAAPFPPIPEAAGRSMWPFAMPLTFNVR